MDQNTFSYNAYQFLRHIFNLISDANFSIKNWSIDHLCFRTRNFESYERRKSEFQVFSKLLIESEVNGRPIATFKLNEPLVFENRVIDLIELPAPKVEKSYQEGFEHIEVVTPCPFSEIISNNPHLDFDITALEKDFNQELKLLLGNYQVKFHHLSLESVVNLERNFKIHSLLNSSKILNHLKKITPLIAGTFPLSIHTDSSDIDIILYSENLVLLQKEVQYLFQNAIGFSDYHATVRGIPSYVANFYLEDVPIELFGQNIPSVLQTAYSHFLIEERLLKLGGFAFLQKIKAHRAAGLKTEPVFAAALSLQGNAYDALLDLMDLSEADLLTKFF